MATEPIDADVLFGGLSEQEARELAEDLWGTEEDPTDKLPLLLIPEEEPLGVPVLYQDMSTGEPLGYKDYLGARVVSFDRKKYTAEEAAEKFEALKEKHGWRLLGKPFWTIRYWCWKIEA